MFTLVLCYEKSADIFKVLISGCKKDLFDSCSE